MSHNSIITISCFFVVITLIFAISTVTTTSIPVEQQKRTDGESDENESITDLPIIDSPCKSSCPPNYKLCLYIYE